MFRRRVPFVKEAALVAAAFLLSAPLLSAGERVHTRARPAAPTQPAGPVAVAASATSFAVVVTSTRPAEPYYVTIRGPDGEVRRFPVEGGPAAIQYQSAPVVLRPGESVTLRLVARK
jgi:hypothetical protein